MKRVAVALILVLQSMSFDEAETLALQTLKQVMEEAITSKNIEVGFVTPCHAPCIFIQTALSQLAAAACFDLHSQPRLTAGCVGCLHQGGPGLQALYQGAGGHCP